MLTDDTTIGEIREWLGTKHAIDAPGRTTNFTITMEEPLDEDGDEGPLVAEDF